MRNGLTFLIAAKRCETAGLQQLVITSDLVMATADLIHALQRERGLSSLYLGAKANHPMSELGAQIQTTAASEQHLRLCLERLDLDPLQPANGARLYNRIAFVLHGLESLPELRQTVAAQAMDAAQATSAYMRLVAGLLAVVFEAADTAGDPDVSRRLVALFNFMQGKELAGQERATGSAMYAGGVAEQASQQRLAHLIDSQERCLEVFLDFAPEPAKALWAAASRSQSLTDLERLRRVLCTAPQGGALNPAMGLVWFGVCSDRMDDMRQVEVALAQGLLQLSTAKMAQALKELAELEKLAQSGTPGSGATAAAFSTAADDPPDAPTQAPGSQLDRSILALVQDQARRLQAVNEELENVRTSLNERKLIERAKGLLMAHRQLTEEDAHKTMRQMAMNQNRRLIDVAKAVLTMAEVLPIPDR
ncbi:MAG: Nitrate regulatory protein [Pseudomonadota bacterium]